MEGHSHHHDPEKDMQEALEEGLGEDFFNHALTPSNVGTLPNPDGFAMPKGACGDFIELYLKIDDGHITDARFIPQGCMNTTASGSALTELAKGAALADAADITAEKIIDVLGGLPKEHRHCAVLAAATLKAAIRDYVKKKNGDWKSAYRK